MGNSAVSQELNKGDDKGKNKSRFFAVLRMTNLKSDVREGSCCPRSPQQGDLGTHPVFVRGELVVAAQRLAGGGVEDEGRVEVVLREIEQGGEVAREGVE